MYIVIFKVEMYADVDVLMSGDVRSVSADAVI